MTDKKLFTASEVIGARQVLINLTVDEMLRSGYVNIPAVLGQERASVYDVWLEITGDKKIQVIKEIRAFSGLGLAESKHITDTAPAVASADLDIETANERARLLREVGAVVSVRRRRKALA